MKPTITELATLEALNHIEETLSSIHKELTKHNDPITYNVTVNSKVESKTDIDKVIEALNSKLQLKGSY